MERKGGNGGLVWCKKEVFLIGGFGSNFGILGGDLEGDLGPWTLGLRGFKKVYI